MRIVGATFVSFILLTGVVFAQANGVPFRQLQDQVNGLRHDVGTLQQAIGALGDIPNGFFDVFTEFKHHTEQSFFDVFARLDQAEARIDSFFDVFVDIDTFNQEVMRLTNRQDAMEARLAASCLLRCTLEYAPVCGSDGKTYVNACGAQCAQVTIARPGLCQPQCTSDEQCLLGSFCEGAGGFCQPQRPNGDACSANNQCTSGFCHNTVCGTRITCCLSDDQCFPSTIESCDAVDGAVMECVPAKNETREPPGVNVTLRAGNTTSEFGRNLTRDAASTNVSRQPYINITHDCDDFAGEMEQNLTSMGYNATFTVYWCYDNAGKTTTAHCVTDVHADDGTTYFVEPQNNQLANLDFDGDGTVEVRTHHENNRVDTDDSCEIEMYDNRAAAIAAGVNMD